MSSAIGLALLTGPASAASGSISGTVTDTSDVGIPGIYVCAQDPELQAPLGRCDFTDIDGNYTIEDLFPWEYTVWFRDESQILNYVSEFHDDKPTREQGDRVVVGDGPVTGIDADLETGGQISGTVTDVATESPIAGILVCAESVSPAEVTYCDMTDSEGKYAVNSLPTGSYRVEFSVTRSPNYITQYYDGKSLWPEAKAVSVSAGSVTPGINAAMEEGIQITGTLFEAGGSTVPWVQICALDSGAEERVRCTSSELDGTYSIAGLPLGTYVVGFAVDHKTPEGLVLHPDGYIRQYYREELEFAKAELVGGPDPGQHSGIDALLSKGEEIFPDEPASPVGAASTPLYGVSTFALDAPANRSSPRRLKCKKGFYRKLKGKQRCVKKGKRQRRRRARHGAQGADRQQRRRHSV